MAHSKSDPSANVSSLPNNSEFARSRYVATGPIADMPLGNEYRPHGGSPTARSFPPNQPPAEVESGGRLTPSEVGIDSADLASLSGVAPSQDGGGLADSRRDAGFTDSECREAEERATICVEFERLVESGLSARQAAKALGRSASWFSGDDSVYARWRRGGSAGLLPRRRQAGAPVSFDVPDWFIPAAQFFYLLTNRNWSRGSVPEAVRRTISLPQCRADIAARLRRALAVDTLPVCSPELRDLILARERAGRALVPERIARQIAASETVVRQFRNPTDAGLDYLSSPGFSRFKRDQNGNHECIRSGDVLEPDDGTINLVVCVPWANGGTPCSERYGVLVGRFQLLTMVDARSMFMPTWSFVVRPRSSYRQEDALTTYLHFMRAHGIPQRIRHEGGVWNSNRVKEALKLSGVESQRVWSPHQKAFVEGRFNALWTKLSALTGGQIGRYRAEMERENDILTACQRGHQDPRKSFPMISEVMAAITQGIGELNGTFCSGDFGRWSPEERWNRELGEKPLRQLEPSSEWMFSPWCQEWTVQGAMVGGKVRLFDEFSVPVDFTAPWLHEFHGARVKCYFDPHIASRMSATLVLAQDSGAHKAGKVLGEAIQVNGLADYARQLLGLGHGPDDTGRRARQMNAAALRREVRSIVPGGAVLASSTEERNGIDRVSRIERGGPAPRAQELAGPPDEVEVLERSIEGSWEDGSGMIYRGRNGAPAEVEEVEIL